jgi:hypothetical protein
MLKHLRPGVELRQKKVSSNDKPWCYFGIGWPVEPAENPIGSNTSTYWWRRDEE